MCFCLSLLRVMSSICRNIISNVHGLITMMPHDVKLGNHKSLCFLPWAHVFGLTCELFAFINQVWCEVKGCASFC